LNLIKKKDHLYSIEQVAAYVSDIVTKESGNVLGDNQQSMVINRLKKRMIDLGDLSASEYCDYLNQNFKPELAQLVSLLTTHHTFFFREFCHFEFLLKNLEDIVRRVRERGDKKIKVLSAACSRGQEVYSLAMFFYYHLQEYPDLSFEIIGTDIDPESIKVASNGVYPYNEIKSIPSAYITNNWQRGTGEISRFAKVKTHIKKHCTFSVMNLFKPESILGSQKFDVIFCRNVFIYFEIADVEKIVLNFKKYLYPQGLFITGLSESLKSISVEKTTLAPSIYTFDKQKDETSAHNAIVENVNPKASTPSLVPSPIRLLAVDDSPSVLKLLEKIFSDDPAFDLIGTASNGLEAEVFLRAHKVDAMTLDIHMPEMDGLEYLKKNFKPGHPPVLIVSSASREDTRYAQQTLRHGACDFVEKPALNNLLERADEIKNKLKMSFLNKTIAKSFKKESLFDVDFKIQQPETKARFLVASFSDKEKVIKTCQSMKGDQPPVFIFFEGNSNFLSLINEELSPCFFNEILLQQEFHQKNKIFICDLKEDFQRVYQSFKPSQISLSVFGIASKALSSIILTQSVGQVLLEDLESINKDIKLVANDIFPWTSFEHLATEYLAKAD
jgi:chemotaxis protein methyltransferase CheR